MSTKQMQDSIDQPSKAMEFFVEMYDGHDHQFMQCHRCVKIDAPGVTEAMQNAFMRFPIKHGWRIAQVLRQFSDCILPQPVFDAINGFAASEAVINTAKTWRSLLLSKDQHEEIPRPRPLA